LSNLSSTLVILWAFGCQTNTNIESNNASNHGEINTFKSNLLKDASNFTFSGVPKSKNIPAYCLAYDGLEYFKWINNETTDLKQYAIYFYDTIVNNTNVAFAFKYLINTKEVDSIKLAIILNYLYNDILISAANMETADYNPSNCLFYIYEERIKHINLVEIEYYRILATTLGGGSSMFLEKKYKFPIDFFEDLASNLKWFEIDNTEFDNYLEYSKIE
jgi:hypothetical protein